LAVLVKAQLLTRIAADRYVIPDLVRWHARDWLVREEPVEAIRSAARSVIEWYLDTTVRFDKALSNRPRVGPRYQVVDAHVSATANATRAEALSWLERERTNLVEAVLLAERQELDDLVWQLCEALWGVFHLHGHYEDWIITHRAGLACAAHSGDRRAEMRMSSQLGAGLLATGDLAEAETSFAGSLAAARDVADSLGEQSALEWLGKVAAKRGDLEPALSYLDHSQRVAESAVDSNALPRTIAILALQRGRFLVASGRLPQALDEFTYAADYFDTTAETDNQAKVALETGRVLDAMDRADEAVPLLQRARTGFLADGSLRGEAATLEALISVGEDTAENTKRLAEIYTILGDARVRELPLQPH
jgi:tetratricopeptide (TPR) repeat protein